MLPCKKLRGGFLYPLLRAINTFFGLMIRFSVFSLSRRRAIVLVVTISVFALTIWFINSFLPYRNLWLQFDTESDISTFFCEYTDMSAIIRQPINTFSNFIYWMVGIAILRRGWKDQSKSKRYNLVCANPFYSITLGCIMLYIFCASTFFHSSLISFASRLDFSSVYSLSLFPLMYFAHRVWLLSIGVPSNVKHTKSTTTVVAVFTTAYLLLTFFLPHGTENYTVLSIIATIIVFGIIVEKRDPGKTNKYYLMASIGSILFAVMWFGFDVYKILCDKDSWVQPHSLWHLFAGVSVFYFYMYIRSEKNLVH